MFSEIPFILNEEPGLTTPKPKSITSIMLSSFGFHSLLLLSHANIWPSSGSTVVVSTSDKSLILWLLISLTFPVTSPVTLPVIIPVNVGLSIGAFKFKEFKMVVPKFSSSFKAADNSFNVFNVSGAESISSLILDFTNAVVAISV